MTAHTSTGAPLHVFMAPAGTYADIPTIAYAQGIHLWDTAGRRYIDVSSGPIVSNLGHGNAHVLAAMQEQARAASFAWVTAFESEANRALAALLAELAGPGLERAFIVSGGSEAVESCIKFARQYAVACGQDSRWKVIARYPSYHGGTLGALAVTGDAEAENLFGPLMKCMPKIPAPLSYRPPAGYTAESYADYAAQALEDEIVRQGPDTVLAFILEPVGGLATGALVAPERYYRTVRAICDRYGVLLIYDEVMSGAGRTGKFLAAQHWPDAQPDLVALAKGIGAGYTPLGIMLASQQTVETVANYGGFAHGHTYNANPLTCAIGRAVLEEVLGRDLINNAAQRGAQLRERLLALQTDMPLLGDVRGLGLLQAIELVADPLSKRMIPLELDAPKRLCRLGRDYGLMLYARRTNAGRYGDWLMICPPLVATEADIDEIVERLGRTLAAYQQELHKAGVL